MAELGVAPAFGLTGFRRALAISVAAVALTSVFLVAGFPYDRLAPRAAAAVESATGTRVTIGRLDVGVTSWAPQLRARNVDVAWPSGKTASFQSFRVRPAWSTAWLRGTPALVIEARSPLGIVNAIVIGGGEPSFDGELQQVSLALLPLEAIAAGTQLDGRVDAQLDVTLAEAGPQGSVHFEATQGSLTLPLLPIGVPFDKLSGDVALGGDSLAVLNAFDLAGPLVALTASGTVGRNADPDLAPLALKARIEAREPAVRSMLQSQGVALDASGAAAVEIGGTLGSPEVVPARARPGGAG
jgi:type II secretion system protein N